MWCGGIISRLVKNADAGEKSFALSRSPTRVDMYVDGFPGPLNNLKIIN
jgi:hypothetical protein